jgi:hypothetical protein
MHALNSRYIHGLRGSQNCLDVSHAELLLVPVGQHDGVLDCILDLSAIHGQLLKSGKIIIGQSHFNARASGELAPNVLFGFRRQVRIVQDEMDTALKCPVDHLGAVRRHEEDAAVVLQNTVTAIISHESWTRKGSGIGLTEELQRQFHCAPSCQCSSSA